MIKKRILFTLFIFVVVVSVGYAAFGDKVNILGTTVSVSSADIKLLADLAGGTVESNLMDSLAGPNFENINPNWSFDYPVKIFNNGTSSLVLTSNSDYETANDPSDLRQIIFMEPFGWDDVNSDGIADATELGSSFGRKTVVKWKTEGFALDGIPTGGIGAYVMRFSTDSIPNTKQGAVAVFDFEFGAVEVQ